MTAPGFSWLNTLKETSLEGEMSKAAFSRPLECLYVGTVFSFKYFRGQETVELQYKDLHAGPSTKLASKPN